MCGHCSITALPFFLLGTKLSLSDGDNSGREVSASQLALVEGGIEDEEAESRMWVRVSGTCFCECQGLLEMAWGSLEEDRPSGPRVPWVDWGCGVAPPGSPVGGT